ncbi:unnamed protein product [Notodromas monacha]|uniref:Major facilitator superfamily (MFS) profile domain-containing protein n=1 Tax=Notodromas monacha TaxID=399045 RepID=A0A7R9GBL6_9CRUS|nr:unnamed protein product [Notodromas monacha]CAG0914936.1 unnamed protein product [Notodromas monacha]
MTTGITKRWSFKERRFVSFFLIYASTFIQGMEIAVVLPTAWKYLRRLGVHDETFLGFLISSVFSGLFVGHCVDRSENTRKVLLYLNLCQIFGHCLYFVGMHPWVLLAARFMCGFGSGIGSACFSELGRASKVSERTLVMTVAFAMRQIGIMVGPMFTLALHRVDTRIGSFIIDEESSAGLVMASLWTVFQCLIFFLYSNVGRDYHRQGVRVRNQRPSSRMNYGTSGGHDSDRELLDSGSVGNNNDGACETKNAGWLTTSEHERRIDRKLDVGGFTQANRVPSSSGGGNNEASPLMGLVAPTDKRLGYFDVLFDDRLVPLLFMQTIGFFVLCLIQTIIPPAVEHYFKQGTRVTSLIFMAEGAQGLCAYVAMMFLAPKIQDRIIVLIGYLMLVLAVGIMGYVSHALSLGLVDPATLFWPFVAGCGVVFVAVPTLSAAAVSLASKVVHRNAQGMAQGLRRTSLFMGVVFGPLWGGAMIYQPLFLYGMSFVLLIVGGVLFGASFRKLFVCRETSNVGRRQDASMTSSSSEDRRREAV